MDEISSLADSGVRTACEITLKALTSAIPCLGSPLSSLMGDLQSMRKERRFLEFLEGIKKDLEGLEQHVNQDFIKGEDFLDIFEETSKKIVGTRQDEKREALRHVLTNSLLSSSISYDEVEEFLHLVDRLRVEHIFILKILKSPITYDEETGNRVGKGGGRITSISQIMRQLLPAWDESTIIEILNELESERLVQHMTSRFKLTMNDRGINHLVNSLTDKGVRFCNFIFER